MTTTASRSVRKRIMGFGMLVAMGAVLVCATSEARAAGQDTKSGEKSQTANARERWLHVRVTDSTTKDESVRVNVPLELAEKVLPTINKDKLHNGKIRFDQIDCHDVDLHALLDAARTSADGEFVTVQNKDSDVRVAKQNGYLLVHVLDKNRPNKKSQVEVKIPMKVVDAMMSGSKDELDLVAGLRALSAQGDTELVSVKDQDNTVRVWLDSKNISD